MQAVLRTTAMELDQTLERLFEDIETADNMTKNAIENDIVNFGSSATKFLIDKVRTARGAQRGVAAMSLIRIGDVVVNALKEEAIKNKEFQWIANYLIKEISGR